MFVIFNHVVIASSRTPRQFCRGFPRNFRECKHSAMSRVGLCVFYCFGEWSKFELMENVVEFLSLSFSLSFSLSLSLPLLSVRNGGKSHSRFHLQNLPEYDNAKVLPDKRHRRKFVGNCNRAGIIGGDTYCNFNDQGETARSSSVNLRNLRDSIITYIRPCMYTHTYTHTHTHRMRLVPFIVC